MRRTGHCKHEVLRDHDCIHCEKARKEFEQNPSLAPAVDYEARNSNMYGTFPCRICGSDYTWPDSFGKVLCDDCGFEQRRRLTADCVPDSDEYAPEDLALAENLHTLLHTQEIADALMSALHHTRHSLACDARTPSSLHPDPDCTCGVHWVREQAREALRNWLKIPPTK